MDDLRLALEELLAWAKRKNAGDPTLHPEEFYRLTEFAARVLEDI